VGVLQGQSSADIDAPIERVWMRVQDVARAPEWQHGIRAVIGVERDPEDRILLADTEIDGRVRALRSQVRFTYAAPTRLSWEQTHGDIKSVSGAWELEDLGAEGTRATYRLAVDLGRLSLLIRGPVLEVLRSQLVGARADELKAVIEADR
jgi:ribosome-associated toxin RatA of RatAB toxin-antitoxin module